MSAEASISVRRWIKWANEEPTEPTSTLVLSSPRSTFVDVRALRPDAKDNASKLEPPSATLAAASYCGYEISSSTSLDRLGWAFAGISERTTTESGKTQGKWSHWVDSHASNADADSIVDEGELSPLPLSRYNPLGLPGEATEAMKKAGEEVLELEKGSMAHPGTGKVTEYEEVWGSCVAYAAKDEGLGEDEVVCVVLKTIEDKDSDIRGVVVRVGQWIQGILRSGDEVVVERWVIGNGLGWIPWNDKGWRQVLRIGSERLSLPCAVASNFQACTEGHEFDKGDDILCKWKVEEAVLFKP